MDVEAAIKAGRETMKEKMDKCCSEPALLMTACDEMTEPHRKLDGSRFLVEADR